MRRTLTLRLRWIAVASLLFTLAAAQAQTLPLPDPIPADSTPEALRSTIIEVRESLCRDIGFAAEILTDTGTLALAIPIVMESTGMQPAEIERLERETCPDDYGDATVPELRSGNRIAAWLVEIHLAALAEVLPTQ